MEYTFLNLHYPEILCLSGELSRHHIRKLFVLSPHLGGFPRWQIYLTPTEKKGYLRLTAMLVLRKSFTHI